MAGNCRCPKCETLFKVPGQATGNIVQCPSCQASLTIAGRKKKQGSRNDVALDAPPTDIRPVSSATAPRRLKTSGHEQFSEFPIARPVHKEHFGISTGIHEGRIDNIYPFRQRKRLWPSIAAVALAIGFVGGLFFLVSWVVDRQGKPETTTEMDSPDVDVPVVSDDKADIGPEIVADNSNVDLIEAAKPEPQLPRVFAEPEFFNRYDWDQVWQRINGYLVRLEITTPTGNREATGMIVDSRGWVVTSLSAIKNATTVKVTGAAKRLQDEPLWLELSDLARGIVASDPQFDVAIIAINRSQVINLADPKLESVDNVVSSQRLLVARTPPPGQAAWITESRVGRRASYAELDEAQQRIIQKNDLSASDPFRWIVCNMASESAITEQISGSPILDLDGRVLAFTTGYSLDGKMFAVPANVVLKLLESIGTSPQLQPFPGNRMAGRGGEPVFAEPVDEFAQATANVEKGIQACRATDWSADNAEEFTAFQNLSKGLFDLQELVNSATNADQQLQRNETLQSILTQISDSLGPDLELVEFDDGKSNLWFAGAISPENPWFVLAVTVSENSITTAAIDGQDAATIRLNGTNELVIAKTGIDGRIFQSGRKLLIFGKGDISRPAPHTSDESSGMVRLVDIHAGFWINLRGTK